MTRYVCILSMFLFLMYGKKIDSRSSEWSLPKDCGKNRFDQAKSPRIVNGDRAQLGQFPWMARIGYTSKKKSSRLFFFCGGSLISKYHVITAAHCEVEKGQVVRLGENHLSSNKDCDKSICAPPHQDIQIKKAMGHASYCFKTSVNDIALVELKKAAQFNDFVQPICFPSGPVSRDDLSSGYLTIAGWGLIKSKPAIDPKYLMYFSGPLVENRRCNAIFTVTLIQSQLCIGYKKGKDSCDGDSGGPVMRSVMDDGENRTYLVGVVSYGRNTCGTGPAVYTDVSHFATWALEKI